MSTKYKNWKQKTPLAERIAWAALRKAEQAKALSQPQKAIAKTGIKMALGGVKVAGATASLAMAGYAVKTALDNQARKHEANMQKAERQIDSGAMRL